MDDRQIIERARAAAPGRRATDFIRVLQGLAPNAGRMKLAFYLHRSVPTLQLNVIKACADWQGFGGSMSDAAVDAEMAPFMPPPPFTSRPCPQPWTAGQPGGPAVPQDFASALQRGADADTQGVIGDWLERESDPFAAAFQTAAHWAERITQDQHGLRAVVQIAGNAWGFRWITPGAFRMGDAKRADQTLHTVQLTRGVWLAETPITQKIWADAGIAVPDGSHFKSLNRPVHGLSWVDAVAACEALSTRLGVTVRLPTEAEWECACRAGTATQTWRGDLNFRGPESANNLPVLDPIAWYTGNCGVDFDLSYGHDLTSWRAMQHPQTTGGVRAVAQKQPNPLGLFDMLGNVAEWCSDWYGQYSGDAIDPVGPQAGNERVLRGGMWNQSWMMAAERLRRWPEGRHPRGLFATALRPVISVR